MQYRLDKYGNKISILGYGCLRFTRTLGSVNRQKAEQEIIAAYNAGVNYFDTAYIYLESEVVIGEIFEKHQIRDKIYIATKLPHYLIKSLDGLEKLFNEQLKRLRTDYIDYYLMHMLNDTATWNRLVEMGVLDWLEEKKKAGIIKQIGFSYHGNSTMFCDLIDAYDWDFCQIQYNYMDEHSQAGRKGLNHAASKGIPVVIMEPLRGGKLVNLLPEEAIEIFDKYKVKHTPAQWAFRWLWNQPEVTCVLSGMNSLEMVKDNIETASTVEIGELGQEEEAMLKNVVKAINSKIKVGCTGCGYCMPCPKNVDIPGTFSAYNICHSEGKIWGLREYFMCTALRKTPTSASNCIGCGKCETHCPQGIDIRTKIKEAEKELEIPLYRWAVKLIKKFHLFK